MAWFYIINLFSRGFLTYSAPYMLNQITRCRELPATNKEKTQTLDRSIRLQERNVGVSFSWPGLLLDPWKTTGAYPELDHSPELPGIYWVTTRWVQSLVRETGWLTGFIPVSMPTYPAKFVDLKTVWFFRLKSRLTTRGFKVSEMIHDLFLVSQLEEAQVCLMTQSHFQKSSMSFLLPHLWR